MLLKVIFLDIENHCCGLSKLCSSRIYIFIKFDFRVMYSSELNTIKMEVSIILGTMNYFVYIFCRRDQEKKRHCTKQRMKLETALVNVRKG